MLTHIHIPVIMTAGGMSIPAKPQLTADGTPEEPSPMTWIPIPPDAPGMENEALALEFRKRFVRGLKLLYKNDTSRRTPPRRSGCSGMRQAFRWLPK